MSQLTDLFTDVANAIRAKLGSQATMTPLEFAANIEQIPSNPFSRVANFPAAAATGTNTITLPYVSERYKLIGVVGSWDMETGFTADNQIIYIIFNAPFGDFSSTSQATAGITWKNNHASGWYPTVNSFSWNQSTKTLTAPAGFTFDANASYKAIVVTK